MIRCGSWVVTAGAVIGLLGCGGQAAPAGGLGTSAPVPDGAALLERTCAECHTLRGLDAYSEYWGEAEWDAMVETMIGYGARLTAAERPVLVRYLAEHYGTATAGAKP